MRTFHDVDERADVALTDDHAVFSVIHGMHTVHDLQDLRHVQVLHEVIIQDGRLYQILRTVIEKQDSYMKQEPHVG